MQTSVMLYQRLQSMQDSEVSADWSRSKRETWVVMMSMMRAMVCLSAGSNIRAQDHIKIAIDLLEEM